MMLSRNDFEELVSARTKIPRSRIDSAARLDEDLGLDSFGLLELTTTLAEIGLEMDEREWLTTETVGGLYDRYRERSADPETASSDGSIDPAGSLTPSSLDQVTPPQMVGKFFRLVPVVPPTVQFLYSLCASPEIGFRWRYGGAVPSYEQFSQDLWQGVLSQFVVESIQTNQPAGHVMCYNPDLALGHSYVGMAMTAQYIGTGIAAEPARLFIKYLFDVWPFHKLYLELPEFNFQQFASVGQVLHIEGRMRNHHYYQGRRWDRLVLAAYRQGEEPPQTAEFAG